MAKSNVSSFRANGSINLNNFDAACKSIATRGVSLTKDIQKACEVAVEYYVNDATAHGSEASKLDMLWKAAATKGSGVQHARLLSYMLDHCPNLEVRVNADGVKTILQKTDDKNKVFNAPDCIWVEYKKAGKPAEPFGLEQLRKYLEKKSNDSSLPMDVRAAAFLQAKELGDKGFADKIKKQASRMQTALDADAAAAAKARGTKSKK